MYYRKKYSAKNRIDGKTVLITGGNTGIGRETTKELYKRGARVIILSLNQGKTETSILKDIKNECKDCENVGELAFKHLDLNELASVRKCAKNILEEEKQINVLINNAGVFNIEKKCTKDGFESHFGINYLGHFLLTLLLLPLLAESDRARIINVASFVHRGFLFRPTQILFDDVNFDNTKYNHFKAYAQSKLAMVMFTKELVQQFKKSNIHNVTTYCLHPGAVATNLSLNCVPKFFSKSKFYKFLNDCVFLTPKQGAQTIIYCALSEELATETGNYYSNCKKTRPSEWAFNEAANERLWKISIELVKLNSSYKM